MKLLYATSIDFPSTRGNRIQVAHMSRAFFAELGDDFLLGLRKNAGAPLGAPMVEMPQARSYALAWEYLRLAQTRGITRVFCREEKLLFFMMLYNRLFWRLPIKFFYEIHHFWHAGWWYRWLLRQVNGVVGITEGLKEGLSAGALARPILVAPDAVDIALFDTPLSQDEARKKLGLPMGKTIALYAGAIDEPWKGAGTFYEASRYLSDDYLLVIVGGKPHYVERFQKQFPPVPAVRMEGYKNYDTELPTYLKAADVLAVPNSAKQEISRISTSPLKVFAYMAAGRPIVASDLPSIREVLNKSNASLVEPDNAEALAQGIQALAGDPARAKALARQARQDVESYTWQKRAKKIIDFIC
jgi:glycosyltransferase involved in cell wall biosynthesis